MGLQYGSTLFETKTTIVFLGKSDSELKLLKKAYLKSGPFIKTG